MPVLEKKTKPASRKPPIHICETDYDRIADIAVRMESNAPELSSLIMDELDRARLHKDRTLPNDVVSLNSEVEFVDTVTNVRRRVRLVLPSDARPGEACISVLTPVGAGLIGMSEGREIDWPCPDGRPRVLRILSVTQPARG
ncbi:nucleoside diphosphate kinase regulator [Sphingomonas parva]|nr:nucleoside diphosphate kinase regulator [Sphingomonas parva]